MIDEKVLIERLEERKCSTDSLADIVWNNAVKMCIGEAKDLASEHNSGWIPCEVIDHPEHCHDCEVTIKDVRGYTREIAYYTDKWRLLRDETPVMVVAWKEPSAPYKKGE